MKICIEDYFGNDVLFLEYRLTFATPKDKTLKVIDEIAGVFGYNVADIENDVVRIQCIDKADCFTTHKKNLLELVTKLNFQLL